MAVTSFNGRTGDVVPAAADYDASIVNYTLPSSGTTRTTEARLSDLVSVADYGASTGATDNSSAINAALSHGGQIYLPPGNYSCKSQINVNASRVRKFFGPGRLVMASPFAGDSLCNVNGTGPCTIEGIGFVVLSATFPDKNALNLGGANETSVIDVSVPNGGHVGIGVYSCNKVYISNVDIADFTVRGIDVEESSNIEICNATVFDTNAAGGGTATNIFISGGTNNWVRNCSSDANGAPHFNIHFAFCASSGAVGNIAKSSLLEAIAGTRCTNLFISGNEVSWPDPDKPSHDSAMSYGECPQLVISNNRIIGPGGMGMIVDTGCYNFVVNGNYIENAGTYSPNPPVGTLHANGIEIEPAFNPVTEADIGGVIANNTIANVDGSTKCQWAIREITTVEMGYGSQNPNRSIIVNNTCINMAAGAVLVVGANSYIGINTQRVGNAIKMVGSNKDIELPTAGKGLAFSAGGSNIKWGGRELVNVAPNASLGTGIGSGLMMFHDISVGGGVLVFFDAGTAAYAILSQIGTSSFVTSDPGPGGNKWWVQPSGVITNRFTATRALDYALVASRDGILV